MCIKDTRKLDERSVSVLTRYCCGRCRIIAYFVKRTRKINVLWCRSKWINLVCHIRYTCLLSLNMGSVDVVKRSFLLYPFHDSVTHLLLTIYCIVSLCRRLRTDRSDRHARYHTTLCVVLFHNDLNAIKMP